MEIIIWIGSRTEREGIVTHKYLLKITKNYTIFVSFGRIEYLGRIAINVSPGVSFVQLNGGGAPTSSVVDHLIGGSSSVVLLGYAVSAVYSCSPGDIPPQIAVKILIAVHGRSPAGGSGSEVLQVR